MAKLPVVSGLEAVRAFGRVGWMAARQRGSHVYLVKVGAPFALSVPLHDELDRGTLRRLIRKAGLTVDEFVAVLRRA